MAKRSHSGSSRSSLRKDILSRPKLKTYPITVIKGRNRSFSSNWYERFDWLEYDEETDAAYCFPCRNFKGSNKLFTETGFRQWDKALEKGRGLASKDWKEKNKREKSSTSVDQLSTKATDKHNLCMEAMFIVIKTLVANGQPLRGHEESTDFKNDNVYGGMFLEILSNIVFPLRPDIAEAAKLLPGNAKYTSPDVQNDIISILAKCVKNRIAEDVRKAEIFTVYADGTSDNERREIFAIVLRYLSKIKLEVEEHVIQVTEAEDRSAKGLIGIIEKTMDKNNLKADSILAQCYDGASVMSGEKGGLQALMCTFCGRVVIYVHCYCHRLHLVVVHIIDSVPVTKDHFNILGQLYNFFKLLHVQKQYDGSSLKRIIATRWSGYHDSAEAFQKNTNEVIKTLKHCKSSKSLDASQRATAAGLLNIVNHEGFLVVNEFVNDILSTLNITVKLLQERGQVLSTVNNVITSTRKLLQKKKDSWNVERISSEMSKMAIKHNLARKSSTRSGNLPKHFEDSLLTEALPQTSVFEVQSLRQTFVEVIDLFSFDFDRRFSEENVRLWVSIDHLLPGDENFLNADHLKPLLEYSLTVPALSEKLSSRNCFRALDAECEVFREPLSVKDWKSNEHGLIDMAEVGKYVLQSFPKTAPILCTLYHVALTIGFTSAAVECVFSRRTYVDTPIRQSMTAIRQSNLTLLYFEKKLCYSITYEEFKTEWRKKARKIVL